MYMTFLHGSPWENSVSFLSNPIMVLATPAELRKASASKVTGFFFPLACFLVFITLSYCSCVRPDGRGSRRIFDRRITGETSGRLEPSLRLGARSQHETQTLC